MTVVTKDLKTRYEEEVKAALKLILLPYNVVSSIKILLQIIYKNPAINFPDNEIGEILSRMISNPNFKPIVKKFRVW